MELLAILFQSVFPIKYIILSIIDASVHLGLFGWRTKIHVGILLAPLDSDGMDKDVWILLALLILITMALNVFALIHRISANLGSFTMVWSVFTIRTLAPEELDGIKLPVCRSETVPTVIMKKILSASPYLKDAILQLFGLMESAWLDQLALMEVSDLVHLASLLLSVRMDKFGILI